MSVIKEYFYNVLCDCCKQEWGHNDLWSVDATTAEEEAFDHANFRHLGGKDYGPACWSFDDDGNIRTKDGRVWDPETELDITPAE